MKCIIHVSFSSARKLWSQRRALIGNYVDLNAEVWWSRKESGSLNLTTDLGFDRLLISIREKLPALSIREFSDSQDKHWAVIDRGLSLDSPQECRTPVCNPRMVLMCPSSDIFDIAYVFEVHFVEFKQGATNDAHFHELMLSLHPGSGYHICDGISKELADQASFSVKNIRRWGYPFCRTDHQLCVMWFQLEKIPLNLKYGIHCSFCEKLHHYLVSEICRRQRVTPDQKAKCALPSSKCPISYLSPNTRAKRFEMTRQELTSAKKKLQKYEKNDVNVGEASNEELLTVVSHIHHKSRSELECLLTEAEKVGKGDILREKWKQDVEDRISFDRDQRVNGTVYI